MKKLSYILGVIILSLVGIFTTSKKSVACWQPSQRYNEYTLYTDAFGELNIKYLEGDMAVMGFTYEVDWYFNVTWHNNQKPTSTDLARILTAEQREQIGLNTCYVCIDNYIYNMMDMAYAGYLAQIDATQIHDYYCTDTKYLVGTLQGWLNGMYRHYVLGMEISKDIYLVDDTEPLEGVISAEDAHDTAKLKKYVNQITGRTTSTTPAKKQEVNVIEKYAEPILMYAVKDCNIRENGSTDYSVTAYMKKGQFVYATGKTDTGWYRVTYNDGVIGYVFCSLLTTEYVTTVEEDERIAEENAKKEALASLQTTFADLDEDALNTISKLIELEISDIVTVKTLNNAEHTILPDWLLKEMKDANKTLIVEVYNSESEEYTDFLYSFKIKDVIGNENINIKASLKDNKIFFSHGRLLNKSIKISISGLDAHSKYRIYIITAGKKTYHSYGVSTMYGKIELSTNALTQYYFEKIEETSVQKDEVAETPVEEQIVEPVIEPEIEESDTWLDFIQDNLMYFILAGVGIIVLIIVLKKFS